jgi:hypothetical protein
MSFSLREVAASSYSGARALQWPHQGAKTARRHQVSGRQTQRGIGHLLTLGEDEAIALDELVKGSPRQLGHVRGIISLCDGSEGGQEAGGETLVLHCACDVTGCLGSSFRYNWRGKQSSQWAMGGSGIQKLRGGEEGERLEVI